MSFWQTVSAGRRVSISFYASYAFSFLFCFIHKAIPAFRQKEKAGTTECRHETAMRLKSSHSRLRDGTSPVKLKIPAALCPITRSPAADNPYKSDNVCNAAIPACRHMMPALKIEGRTKNQLRGHFITIYCVCQFIYCYILFSLRRRKSCFHALFLVVRPLDGKICTLTNTARSFKQAVIPLSRW